jgi:PAS domain S-box-containing protein
LADGLALQPVVYEAENRDDEGGRVVAAVAVVEDISESKRAEDQLREANRQTEDILESISDTFLGLDREWRFTYINEPALRSIQAVKGDEELTREEVLGMNAWELFPEYVGSVFDHKFHEAMREQKSVEFEAYSTFTDRWVEVHAYPSEEGLSLYIRDITDRKRAEDQLREANRQTEDILESTTDGFYAMDGDWRFTYLNARAVRFASQLAGKLAGEEFTHEGLLGRTLWETLPATVGTKIEEEYRRAVREQQTTIFEYPYPGGSQVFEVHAYPSKQGLSVYFQDITERKRAEEQLSYHAHLLENVLDAVIATDEHLLITAWNKGAEQMYGWRADEVLGRNLWEAVPSDLSEEQHAEVLRELAERGRFRTEATTYGKDGTPVYVEGINVALRGGEQGEGEITGYVNIRRDITERKEAEEALRYQLSLTETITDKAADPMLMLDAQGSITFANPAAEQMFGWRREELRGEVLHDKLHHHYPDGRPYPRSECPIMHALATQRTLRDHEDLFFRKDGSTVDVSCSYAPFIVEGEVAGAVLVVRDITHRKQAQKEREKRTHQQAVVADFGLKALAYDDLQLLMDEAVALVARTLDVEYSEVMEVLSGGEELLVVAGVGWDEGVVGDTMVSAGFGSQAGYALISEEPVIIVDLATETRFDPPSLLVEHGAVSGMSVVIHGQQRPFGVICADTTSHRTFSEDDINFLQAVANVLAMAIERKEAQEKLDEVREAERSRIARDLHDDALQDLSGALVDAQRLKALSTDSEASRLSERLLATLDRVGPHLKGAIYDLSLDREHDRPFDVLLVNMVELQRTMAPHLQIALDVQEGILEGSLGETGREILRILGEALTNARRHSEATNVWVRVGISNGILCGEVEDDGRGFDPTQEEPTPPGSTGGGVGIGAMGERANLIGGKIKIESESGKGTKVRFELVLQRVLEEAERGVHILLVEDHTSIREALGATFEGEGFRVVGQAGSMAEARGMLDEMKQPIDVAVVDLGLPDGYGADLIKEVREKNPQAQALVLSASLERANIARAVELGAAGVLSKTAHLEEVVDAVRRLRAGETLMPPEEVVELLRFASSRREEEHEVQQATEKLSSREMEVLQALAIGLDSQQIADRLHISLRTERNHMASILKKLGVHSQLQALVFALRYGVVEVP